MSTGRARPRSGVRILAALLAAVAGSCGYSAGLRVSERHASVGVEIFENQTLERDLERPLADEITRALRDWSEAALADPRRAEVVVRGTIAAYHRRPGIRSADNQTLETGLFVEVEAALWRAGATKPERGPVKAGAWVGYVVGPEENERSARDRALRRIAEQLVLDLFSPLG